jgi:hypothetical protein
MGRKKNKKKIKNYWFPENDLCITIGIVVFVVVILTVKACCR